MARKSKYTVTDAASDIPAEEKVYKTAIYTRLSVADNGAQDSDSLANQQHMLESYIADRTDLKPCGVFTDNGATGTNFLRPAWNALIAACKAGKIDCIVVKDLSRLGRNYIETGEYMEMILPLLEVRLVAVNDGYDSLDVRNGKRLVYNLKNLVNDIYAKDISRKSASALRMKQKNGDFIGSYAAYGYLKDPHHKNRIIVDAETATIVRQIFSWKAEGVGSTNICSRLNGAGILSPCKYRLEKGILKDTRYSDCLWRVGTIIGILRNPVYLGHMAQGKQAGALYEGKGVRRPPVSEWVVVKDTHPAIVDEALFTSVQRIMDDRTGARTAVKRR